MIEIDTTETIVAILDVGELRVQTYALALGLPVRFLVERARKLMEVAQGTGPNRDLCRQADCRTTDVLLEMVLAAVSRLREAR